MRPSNSHPSDKTLITSVVPSFVSWRTYPRAVANLLLFGLAVVLGEWIVHQLEYRFEYGRHFQAVMAATPHRFYMAPLGLALAVAGVILLSLAALALLVTRARRRRLLLLLPPRLARHVPGVGVHLSVRALAQTALTLASLQVLVYLLQENLESAAVSAGWPGLAVLFAPQHLTVVPLHLLAATCASLLLWTVSAWLRRSHRAFNLARVLVAVLGPRETTPPRLIALRGYLPNLRLVAGILCLRSPPLSA